jgi:hypothetical protein
VDRVFGFNALPEVVEREAGVVELKERSEEEELQLHGMSHLEQEQETADNLKDVVADESALQRVGRTVFHPFGYPVVDGEQVEQGQDECGERRSVPEGVAEARICEGRKLVEHTLRLLLSLSPPCCTTI